MLPQTVIARSINRIHFSPMDWRQWCQQLMREGVNRLRSADVPLFRERQDDALRIRRHKDSANAGSFSGGAVVKRRITQKTSFHGVLSYKKPAAMSVKIHLKRPRSRKRTAFTLERMR